jgi:hypothetical protein
VALTAANVRVAVTGAVYAAPVGTAAPTAHDSALDVAFVDLGYVSEDGVTETRDRSTEQIRAWQQSALVREVVTDSSITYDLTLIETSEAVVELFYGATADGTDGQIDIDPGTTGGVQSFVIDVIDGSSTIRTYIPRGEITAVGDQVYAAGEAVGYPITITAYDSAGTTVTKWYSDLVDES